MTSECRIAANRANARRSTGPRTPAGRARSARNAMRHGLSISVLRDAKLRAEVEALARRLAAEGGPFDLVLPVAETTIDLQRIRNVRETLLRDAVAGPPRVTAGAVRLGIRAARAALREAPDADARLKEAWALMPDPTQSAGQREARVLTDMEVELRRLARYERRALSRRKRALRALDAARTSVAHARISDRDRG